MVEQSQTPVYNLRMAIETAEKSEPFGGARCSRNPIRRLYNWVLSWADRPHGTWALALLSFSEASFFPVPPDVLLIALGLSRPRRAFWYATVCSLASVGGGIAGYVIGWKLYELVGQPIIAFYELEHEFAEIRRWFGQWGVWMVAAAGFTPIPYKVFTIASGVAGLNFWLFLAASAVSRSARFFIVSALMRFFGEKARKFVDRYFNLLTLAFFSLLVLGFLAIRLFKR